MLIAFEKPTANRPEAADISPYLLVRPRILRDACRATRRGSGGRLCPDCCLRDFCEKQAMRAGQVGSAD